MYRVFFKSTCRIRILKGAKYSSRKRSPGTLVQSMKQILQSEDDLHRRAGDECPPRRPLEDDGRPPSRATAEQRLAGWWQAAAHRAYFAVWWRARRRRRAAHDEECKACCVAVGTFPIRHEVRAEVVARRARVLRK